MVGLYSVANLPLSVRQKISFGLMNLLPNGETTPAAALSWDVVNNLIYTYKIKPNLYWHNGKKFLAGDVNYKIKDANITVIDDYTLRIELKEPYSPLNGYLSQPLLLDHLNGLGNYKIVKIDYRKDNKIQQLTLLPFDRSQPTQTYKFYPNTQDALLAFKLGEIDMLEDLDTESGLLDWKNLEVDSKSFYNEIVA